MSILFHILAKQKEQVLDYWLEQNLDKINYPKDKIILYFRTNNNTDNTLNIITKWISNQQENTWNNIILDSTDVPEKVEAFGIHEWNKIRFSVLGRLRQEGINKAILLNTDFYFVCDVDNFLIPDTLSILVNTIIEKPDINIIAPILKCVDNNKDFKYANSNYSNFHHPVNTHGYFMNSNIYYEILNRTNKSLHNVDLVHCTYLINKNILNMISYSDNTNDYEYVIFSRNLRKNNIQQILDTRYIYGCLTLTENLNNCKQFMENNNMINVFTNIYEQCEWGNNNNNEYNGSSGDGSSIYYNMNTYIPFVKNFINNNDIVINNNDYVINTIVDLGCGDFRFNSYIYEDINIVYTGYDAYKKLIDYNVKTHSSLKYNFIHLDFLNNKEDIINADLCIIKDVLQHWTLDNIYKFIDYLIETKKFKYILICNCCNQTIDNTDIMNGEWRPLSSNYLPLKKYNPIILLKYNTKEVSLIKII